MLFSNGFISIIPYELLAIILDLSVVASIFALSRTSKSYLQHRTIKTAIIDNGIHDIWICALTLKYTDMFKWLMTSLDNELFPVCDQHNLCREAAATGRLQILIWFHENKYPWNEMSSIEAAKNNHLEILQYLHENKCPWNERVPFSAATHGNHDILEYLIKNNCPIDRNLCLHIAIRNGHLEIVRYLHEIGSMWTGSECDIASDNGHFEILEYLHQTGCPCDKTTCNYCIDL